MKHIEYLLFALIVQLSLSGCVTQTTEIKTPTFDQQLSKPKLDYSSGSIWQANSTSLTDDYKARHKGDIITIVISENASASKAATPECPISLGLKKRAL